jgi:hypothetical protein
MLDLRQLRRRRLYPWRRMAVNLLEGAALAVVILAGSALFGAMLGGCGVIIGALGDG